MTNLSVGAVFDLNSVYVVCPEGLPEDLDICKWFEQDNFEFFNIMMSDDWGLLWCDAHEARLEIVNTCCIQMT